MSFSLEQDLVGMNNNRIFVACVLIMCCMIFVADFKNHSSGTYQCFLTLALLSLWLMFSAVITLS